MGRRKKKKKGTLMDRYRKIRQENEAFREQLKEKKHASQIKEAVEESLRRGCEGEEVGEGHDRTYTPEEAEEVNEKEGMKPIVFWIPEDFDGVCGLVKVRLKQIKRCKTWPEVGRMCLWQCKKSIKPLEMEIWIRGLWQERTQWLGPVRKNMLGFNNPNAAAIGTKALKEYYRRRRESKRMESSERDAGRSEGEQHEPGGDGKSGRP